MAYQENPDHTWPALPERVSVTGIHCNPRGLGRVVSQTPWTAIVQMDADGKAYLFGKCAVEPA